MLDQAWIQNRHRLRAVIRSIVPDSSCVDDLLQEALLKALRTGRKFDTPTDAFHFLYRVAVNTTIDYYRRNGKKRQDFRTTERQYHCLESQEDVRHGSNPLVRLLRHERRSLQGPLLIEVERALRKLPRQQREAIWLIFGQRSRTLKEICAERGLAYSTVRSRMLRGVDQIRSHLRERGFYSDDE